jgi:hypothetical protein
MVEDSEDEDEANTIDVDKALCSAEYKKYINACGELEKVDILNLTDSQRIAVFLNVY